MAAPVPERQPVIEQVEGGKVTTSLLTRAIVERNYLRVSYITDLMAAKAGRVTAYEPGCALGEEPVTFVGLEQPGGTAGRIDGVHAEPAP